MRDSNPCRGHETAVSHAARRRHRGLSRGGTQARAAPAARRAAPADAESFGHTSVCVPKPSEMDPAVDRSSSMTPQATRSSLPAGELTLDRGAWFPRLPEGGLN